MDYEEFLELNQERQSIRTWSNRKVSLDKIRQLIKVAQEAPTACNHQMNRFVVVNDQNLLNELDSKAGTVEWVKDAPVGIVNIIRMGWNHNKFSVIQSLAMAEQNILLGAQSLGLVGLIQAGIGNTEKIREILDIPEGYYVASIISLGYPADDGEYPRPPRLSVDDVMSVNSFNEPTHLRFPRKDTSADLSKYSNSNSPDSVWNPERWPLEAVGTFRGNAVWSTHPRENVHCPDRMREEFNLEVDFFKEHITKGDKILEFLPYSAAYGSKLMENNRLANNQWDVFELTSNHEAFIEKRCDIVGVKSPDNYYHDTEFDRKLPGNYDRIFLARGLNHIPFSGNVFKFFARNLKKDGQLLISFKNILSFEWFRWLKLQKGQVWNFGPYKPFSLRKIKKFSQNTFEIIKNKGITFFPKTSPDCYESPIKNFCRTICLVMEKKN